jgi:endoglucanase
MPVPNIDIAKYDISDNDAMKFVKNMKLGWNLGNTFDAYNATWLTDEMEYESVWCGAKTTEELIDTVKEAGFNSIRIPVSWHNHVSGDDFKISEAWINRVQEVVNYCIDNDMYVILNIHHDNEKSEKDNAYFYPSSEYLENSKKYITSIWSQLSEKFANYDDHLIYESMNEPRLIGHTNEWWIDPNNADVIDSIKCINELNQTFVDTVRATGGNNANRYVMTPGYCASSDGAINENFKLPTDINSNKNKVIVSVHAYTPYDFALQGDGGIDTWSVDDKTSKDNMTGFMDKLYKKYTKQGIPVVIGEFGARDRNGNIKSRTEFASYYIAAARARGISCFWWDNNAFVGSGENFGLIDRTTYESKYPGIVQGMVKYSVENESGGTGTYPTESISKSLLIGRFDTSDPSGPKFAWSNSTIKANFKGTGISVYLKSAGDNWFNVIIDGVVKAPINIATLNSSPINLAAGLTNGNHTIELVKRTEAYIGEVQFLGFTVTDGELLAPPAASSKGIMVIGDSISCGYGNEGTSQNETFTTKNENADLSYVAVTARLLGADLVNTSWSGKGLMRNYGGDTTNVMPQIYNQILPYNSSLLWDSSKWTPQVVVINLGTNDFSIGIPDKGSFSRAYRALVNSVRKQYPNAEIYCAVGPMLSGDNLASATDYIKRIVNLQTTLGDENINFIQFPAQDGTTGYGEDWHPSLQTHEDMAKQLAAQIQSDLGW